MSPIDNCQSIEIRTDWFGRQTIKLETATHQTTIDAMVQKLVNDSIKNSRPAQPLIPNETAQLLIVLTFVFAILLVVVLFIWILTCSSLC